MMDEAQMHSLEAIYPVKSAGYNIQGVQNDGCFYDPTRSHDWNTQMPSLGYRQYMSVYDTKFGSGDIVEWILAESEDTIDFGKTQDFEIDFRQNRGISPGRVGPSGPEKRGLPGLTAQTC